MKQVCLILAASLALVGTARADSKLLADLHGHYDAAPDVAKTKLGCKGDWQSADGHGVTTLTCASSAQTQITVKDNAVLAIGYPLVDRGSDRDAQQAFKGGGAELAAAKCKSLADRGQMTIYQCPGRFVVILMFNWNSKDNTNTTTAMAGPADPLLALVGIKPDPMK